MVSLAQSFIETKREFLKIHYSLLLSCGKALYGQFA